MGTNEVILAATVDILQKKREFLTRQAALIENFENSIIKGKEFYSLVIIPKPVWAQSESQEDIKVINKGDLEAAIEKAKELCEKKYKSKPTDSFRPITIGILLPSARDLPMGIGDDWFSLIVNGKIPGAREEGNLLGEEGMGEEEMEKLRSSRFIEFPKSVWAPFFNK